MEREVASNKNDYTLTSVKNALLILRSFTLDEPEKKISELSKSLGLGKSTTSRLMLTLASEGFVKKNPKTQRYRLGTSLLGLGAIVNDHLDIQKEALPVIQDVVKKLNETVHVSVLEGSNVGYLHVMQSTHQMRFFVRIGESNPAYCTSSGKAILAYQDDEFIQKIIDGGLHSYTDSTITNPDHLIAQLQAIRVAGYAVSDQEKMQGVMGIAAPIRNHLGQVFAALSVVGPIERIGESKIPIYAQEIKEAALKISKNLGYVD